MFFFDWSSTNRVPIDPGRLLSTNFLIFSTDRDTHSIDWKLWILNFSKCFHMDKVQGYVWWDYTCFLTKNIYLKHLVGDRYKGWISRPPLSVHSSMGKHLVLVNMPRGPKGGCLLHSTTRFNYPFKVVWASTSSWHTCLAIPKEGILFHVTDSF